MEGGVALARRGEMAVVWTVAERAVGVATAAWAAVANGIDPREGGRIASQRGRCNQVRNQGRGHGGVIRISRKKGGGGEIHARGQSHVRGFQSQRKRFRGTIPHNGMPELGMCKEVERGRITPRDRRGVCESAVINTGRLCGHVHYRYLGRLRDWIYKFGIRGFKMVIEEGQRAT